MMKMKQGGLPLGRGWVERALAETGVFGKFAFHLCPGSERGSRWMVQAGWAMEGLGRSSGGVPAAAGWKEAVEAAGTAHSGRWRRRRRG